MKKLSKMMDQHGAALKYIPLWFRFGVALFMLAVFAFFVYVEAPAYLTGLSIALLSVGLQLLIGAWKLPEDWVWMTIFFTWYNILYTSLALLF